VDAKQSVIPRTRRIRLLKYNGQHHSIIFPFASFLHTQAIKTVLARPDELLEIAVLTFGPQDFTAMSAITSDSIHKLFYVLIFLYTLMFQHALCHIQTYVMQDIEDLEKNCQKWLER